MRSPAYCAKVAHCLPAGDLRLTNFSPDGCNNPHSSSFVECALKFGVVLFPVLEITLKAFEIVQDFLNWKSPRGLLRIWCSFEVLFLSEGFSDFTQLDDLFKLSSYLDLLKFKYSLR